MMHLMCPAYSPEVRIVRISKQPETLVNKHIMYQEVSQPIQRNAETNKKQVIITHPHTKEQARHSRDSEDQKEEIIIFKKALRFFFMMIPMQAPQKPMHQILVRDPGNAFHTKKGRQHNCYINYNYAHLQIF